MKFFSLFLICIFICNIVYGQEKNPFKLIQGPGSGLNFELATPKITKSSFKETTADAIAHAVADLSSLPEEDRPFQRYVWIPDADKAKVGQVSFAVNTAISKASVIIKPAVVAQNRLVRWDLRTLAPRDGQYPVLHALWEKLAFEPYFHIVKTTDDILPTDAAQQESLAADPPGSSRFKVGNDLWFKSSTGAWFILDSKRNWIPKEQPAFTFRKENVPVYGAHTGLTQAVMLQGLSQSNAAIVRYDWFMTVALTTLKAEKSPYTSGLYYEFIGVERNPKGKTAQQAFLETIGVSEKQIEELRSDQRSAQFRSKVTGRPRRVDLLQGSGVRLSSGSGLVSITHDTGEGQVDAANDPIRNLLNFTDKAREVIAERPNGMHYFLLFNAQGGLQDSAPDDVVKDHTIPAPHPARLQPGISCIRCHGPNDGWQPFDNDVQKMLKGLLNVFDDLSGKEGIPDTLERLAGLYSGDLEKPLRRGRDDYSDAVFQATSGLSVSGVSEGLSTSFGKYNYDLIDAQTACLELGYEVPDDKAVQYLNMILPPLQKDFVGISPEDPIIGALKAGISVNRFQFEQVYADMAFRAMQSQQLRNQQKSK